MSLEGDTPIHRPIIGVESLMLQGLPIMAPPFSELVEKLRVADAFLQDIAGNAFSSSVVCALLVSTIFAADLKPGTGPRATTSTPAVEDVLDLFAKAASPS